MRASVGVTYALCCFSVVVLTCVSLGGVGDWHFWGSKSAHTNDVQSKREILGSDLTWMSQYQPAESLFSHSVLPANKSVLMFTRVFRIFGTGILPLQQSLIDVQANVVTLHCKPLRLGCVGYLIAGDVPDIHQVLQQDEDERCQTVCMVRIHPEEQRTTTADCPACASIERQTGFEQFDLIHAVTVGTITRESYLPMAMRLKWSPTTSKAQLNASLVKGDLPQMEQHIVHNAQLAQHIPRWQPYKALSISLEMQGPNVAPFTLGKQNLLLYTLRQLEKNYYVDGQTFRLGPYSHDEETQQANATVIIVQSTQAGLHVGLEKVLKSFQQQIQDSFNDAGLHVTDLHITAPVPYPNVTVADQIAVMLGPPSLWQQYRKLVASVAAAYLASVVITYLSKKAMALLHKARIRNIRDGKDALDTWQVPVGARQKKFLEDMANKYARLLHMNLYTGLSTDLAIDLEVCRLPNGAAWVLGYGACGIVYKAKRDGVQDVALKVLAAPATENIQLLALKKEICLLRALSYDQNIVQFYGACLDPEFPALVLEYMEGGDLFAAIQRDAYPEPLGQFGWYGKGAQIALDVAKGLVFLHKNKVVHNDIKSSNILLSKDATIAKISDVGTSRILEQTCSTGTAPMMCTFAYAAPEQLMGRRAACTEKVDMFSFGAVLWEIVTQEAPRRGRLRATNVPAECPQVIEDLISACLEASPADRPSAKAVCHILEDAIQSQQAAAAAEVGRSDSASSVFCRSAASVDLDTSMTSPGLQKQ